jgi:NAD(P)-dependent dehydrogenase (short-subunit alcohol dehydrogenase family)
MACEDLNRGGPHSAIFIGWELRCCRQPHRRALTPSNSKRSSGCLIGRVALVTGATRGIGLAISRALARESCSLILTCRDGTALSRVRKELVKLHDADKRIHTLAQACDVRDPHSVDALFRAIRQECSRLDILINNAGIAHANLPIDKLPFPIWKDVLATNLDGTFLITQAGLAIMRRGGTIVNNLSIAANRVFPGSAAYNASKHGILGVYEHAAPRASPARYSRHRIAARRDRYGHLEHALAASPAPKDDVAKSCGTSRD